MSSELAEFTDVTELAEVACEQLRTVLEGTAPRVVAQLRDRILEGKIDGCRYWRGGCGCVLATIAFLEGSDCPPATAMGRPIEDVIRIEDWTQPIRPGDVPDHTAFDHTGPFRAALLVAWIDEFEAERVSA